MKKINKFSYITLLMIFFSFPLYGLDLISGIKIPFGIDVNTPKGLESWTGIQYGVTAFADLTILKRISAEADLGYTKDQYNLNDNEFTKGSYLIYNDLRTTIIGKYWFLSSAYAGIGTEFITQLSGTYGNDQNDYAVKDENLGTDTYITFLTGYQYSYKPELSLYGEVKFTYDLTVADTTLYDTVFRLGVGFHLF